MQGGVSRRVGDVRGPGLEQRHKARCVAIRGRKVKALVSASVCQSNVCLLAPENHLELVNFAVPRRGAELRA